MISSDKRGKGCMDQISAVKMTIAKYLDKDWNLFATLRTIGGKAYDRVERHI